LSYSETTDEPTRGRQSALSSSRCSEKKDDGTPRSSSKGSKKKKVQKRRVNEDHKPPFDHAELCAKLQVLKSIRDSEDTETPIPASLQQRQAPTISFFGDYAQGLEEVMEANHTAWRAKGNEMDHDTWRVKQSARLEVSGDQSTQSGSEPSDENCDSPSASSDDAGREIATPEVPPCPAAPHAAGTNSWSSLDQWLHAPQPQMKAAKAEVNEREDSDDVMNRLMLKEQHLAEQVTHTEAKLKKEIDDLTACGLLKPTSRH